MTHAYGVFANEGVAAAPRSILRIEDNRGNIVEENSIQTKRVMESNVALMISDVLSDNVARTPLWGANSLVNFTNRSVASKTGSTNNFYDAWLMGYSPNLAVGVWSGNNIPESMNGLSGLIVTPMWRDFMNIALEKLPDERFQQPTINRNNVKPILRGVYADLDMLSVMLQSGGQIDLNKLYGNIHNILHFVDRTNPNGPVPINPGSESQYDNWEYAVQKWKLETYGVPTILETTEETAPEVVEGTTSN
jgi:membrane peptidoglycan carboxypeptidase